VVDALSDLSYPAVVEQDVQFVGDRSMTYRLAVISV
jgi:hypothetical protein